MHKSNISIKRLYPGMYTFTKGNRTVRVYRNEESRKLDRWWVTANWVFGPESVIDAMATYSEARQAAISVLKETGCEHG